MQILAKQKLKENEVSGPLSESEIKKRAQTNEDELTEGAVNRIINKTVVTFLEERLPKKSKNQDDFLYYKDTLDCITFLLKKKTNGRGSQPAVRRAIDVYCCSLGDFEMVREEGRRLIRRRKGLDTVSC